MSRKLSWLVIAVLAGVMTASAQDRWLHVRVDNPGDQGERVRVNVPLSMAEQVIPAIDAGNLHNGCVEINGNFKGVDLPALLAAVRHAPNGEFVTVRERDSNVDIAKRGGFLLIHVRDKNDKGSQVDVKVPLAVANALLSAGKNQLDVEAAIRALKNVGDVQLVTVHDGSQSVRIWIDSRNVSD